MVEAAVDTVEGADDDDALVGAVIAAAMDTVEGADDDDALVAEASEASPPACSVSASAARTTRCRALLVRILLREVKAPGTLSIR